MPKPNCRHLACCALLLCCAGLATGEEIAGLLRTGYAQVATGQLNTATSQFSRALSLDPRCAEAHLGLGLALLRGGQPETALAEFDAAARLDPALTVARLGRAAALLFLQRWEAAELEYLELADPRTTLGQGAQAARAWLRCREGDFRSARELAAELAGIAEAPALAAYVLAAADFALQPERARPVPPSEEHSGSYVGLGSPLTEVGATWSRLTSLAVVAVPPLSFVPTSAAVPLDLIAPRPGETVSGAVSLVVRGRLPSPPAYAIATIGGRFAAMGRGLTFSEPLDPTGWPAGPQPLRVEAFDAGGHRLAAGEITVQVPTRQFTWAERARPADMWARRLAERQLVPDLQPGVWAQLQGQAAWYQGRLGEAHAHLAEAFCTDPRLPRVRQELLTVSRGMGLPVLQPATAVSRGPSRGPVALTFDDGPHPRTTPWILDLLERYQAPSTFFLVGKQVEMYPDLARQIVARGHEVAVHGHSHVDLTSVTPADVERELVDTRAALLEATGEQTTLFRPPGGNFDDAVARACSIWGFTPVFWTCNICDFYRNPRAKVVPGMMDRIGPGGIVLLHNGEDLTTEILPELLQALRAAGYTMNTVSALLATRN